MRFLTTRTITCLSLVYHNFWMSSLDPAQAFVAAAAAAAGSGEALNAASPTRAGDNDDGQAKASSSEASTPATPQLPAASGDDPSIPSVKLGETIRFEEWGPIILNTDGTTRRIANWDNLTDNEKKVTWRRISKRNEERRLKLLQEQQQEQTAEESSISKKDEL